MKALCIDLDRMIFRYVIFLVLLTAVHSHIFGNLNVREVLNTIPQDEKETLKLLFYDLFNENNFSYTLFGDKPMSLAGYFTTSLDHSGAPMDEDISFWNKWELWKKYAHAFPTTKYLLIEEPREKDGAKQIYFINKKYFIKKVDQNLNLFQKEFGKNITGSILLRNIENNSKTLYLFDNKPGLLGVLLGYGKHNSFLFDKRNKLSPFVYRKELPEIPVKIPNPSEGFSSLKEEFNSYFSILTHFGDVGYSPLVIESVHFVADKTHPETITLQQKYRKMRGNISAIYSSGDFLEITLSKLTEE